MTYNYTSDRLILSDTKYPIIGEIYFPSIATDNSIAVLEHVFVHPDFDATEIGAQLITEFVSYATQNHLTIKLLDPWAKTEFSKHPSYQKILVNE
jgi:predicted GNAT family acetyltransferase